VICFDRIVAVLLSDVTGGGQQIIKYSGVSGRSVGGHFGGQGAVLQRVGEEPAGRG
jgi:hypothetical protein